MTVCCQNILDNFSLQLRQGFASEIRVKENLQYDYHSQPVTIFSMDNLNILNIFFILILGLAGGYTDLIDL